MNCWDAEQLFDAYLDGQLSTTLRLELDAHRLRCSRCRQSLAMMDACVHVVSKDEPPALSEDFTSRVMNAIAERAAEPQPIQISSWLTPARRRIAFAAIAQVAAVVLFVSLWPGSAPPRATNSHDGAPRIATKTGGDHAAIDFGRALSTVGSGVSAARATLASDAGGWASIISNTLSVPSDLSDLLNSNPIAYLLIGLPPAPADASTVATDEGSL